MPSNPDLFQIPKKSISLCILWCFVFPQILLASLNVRSWLLVQGEANQQEQYTAISLFGFSVLLILLELIVYWLYKQQKLVIGWKWGLASLILHASCMWLFLVYVEKAIPDSIQPWILNEGNVGRWNITLLMPGAFLSIYVFSKFSLSNIKESKSGLIALFAAIGMPLVWYLFVSTMQPAWFGQFSVIGSILITTVIVVLFLAAIIRLFDNTIHTNIFSDVPERHYVIAALLGLAAPLGGLTLNHEIPFPVDFQSTGVYVLTILNGLVLLIKPGGNRFSSLRLFFRCLTFPFIFYFFLVFLPFLPLSLLAILAIGAGLLMLTPLALGLFQFRITLKDFKICAGNIGKGRARALCALGLIVLPCYFLTQALLDKRALDSSLAYFYSYDFSDNVLSSQDINRASSALIQLRDRKSGIQLPYISGFYNSTVFGNLVLSDKKIAQIYRLLNNQELPDEEASIIGSRRQSTGRFRGRIIAPKTDTEISNIEHISSTPSQSTVKLTIKNLIESTHTLFVTPIQIPEGVFISGLRLKIEDEWVSGQIFDKKTALWVFQKITEVRRDPALLYYESPTLAQLRVYPFPNKGVREVEIDFSYHRLMDAKITIGENQIDLNAGRQSQVILAGTGNMLMGNNISDFAFQRKPYVHFLLDYSRFSKLDASEYAKKVVRTRGLLGIDEFCISAVNVASSGNECNEYLDTADHEEIENHIRKIKLTEQGGLWLEKAFAKNILDIDKSLNSDSLHRVPVFALINGNDEFNSEVNLDQWSWLIPDMKSWYSYSTEELVKHELLSSDNQSVSINNVVALKQGDKISLLPTNRSSIYNLDDQRDLQVFSPAENKFINLEVNTNEIPQKVWANYAKIWVEWRDANLSPASLEGKRNSILRQSKELELLLPTTSFIVVESASQWEILKRKEKQSLSNHSALDFEDEQQTSEPPWWLLLFGLLFYLYLKDRNFTFFKKVNI